jgi:hypothetical protein
VAIQRTGNFLVNRALPFSEIDGAVDKIPYFLFLEQVD